MKSIQPEQITTGRRVVTAKQVAYHHIRKGIFDGTYRGGDLLKPNVIAEQLEISRMPVREALLKLDAEGLVTLRLNRTAVVTNVTTSEIADLFEMRAALEALTASGIAANVNETALNTLEQLRTAMDEVSSDSNGEEWARRHVAFHDFLLNLCGRPRLAAEIMRLRSALQPYLLLYVHVYPDTEVPGMEHKTLIAAIRSRNAELIEQCFREHVISAGKGIIQFLDAQNKARNLESDQLVEEPRPLRASAL